MPCQVPYKYGGSSTGGAGAGLPYAGGVDSLQAGIWVPGIAPFGAMTTSLVVPNNASRGVRFACPRSQTITRMAFLLTVAASVNDNVDLGIISADGATLIGSSGPTLSKLNQTVTGGGVWQTVNLTAGAPLVAGTVYYAVMATPAPGGTGASVLGTNFGTAAIAAAFGSTLGTLEQVHKTGGPPISVPFSGAIVVIQAPVLVLLQ